MVNLIREYIQDGRLGEYIHVYLSFVHFVRFRDLAVRLQRKKIAGGGSLIDWGVHYLDLVMYCLNDPKPLTVSGETFCKLGKNMEGYVYRDMWAGPPKYDGVYDVDDSVTALVRTEGPVFTVHGAWAQNIDENEQFIDLWVIRAVFG